MIVLYNCGFKKEREKEEIILRRSANALISKRFGCVATWISYIVYMSL